MSNSPSNLKSSLQDLMAGIPNIPPDYEEKRLAQIAEDEARERANAIALCWGRSGVPERHAKVNPEIDGDWGAAWERLKPRLGKGCIIPIIGVRGAGKTQLAVAAIRYVCEHKAYASYTKAMAIFLDLRDAMIQKERSEKEAIKSYTTQRLLVIDAMEVRGETDFENRVLDYIIDMRYDAGLDTILISNQKKEEFTQSLGPSIVSRIHESGELIECVWDSFRKPGKTTQEVIPFDKKPGRVGEWSKYAAL